MGCRFNLNHFKENSFAASRVGFSAIATVSDKDKLPNDEDSQLPKGFEQEAMFHYKVNPISS